MKSTLSSNKSMTIGEAAEREAMERSKNLEEGLAPSGSPDFVRSVSTPPFSYSSPLARSSRPLVANRSSSVQVPSAGHERKMSDFSLRKSEIPSSADLGTLRPPVTSKLSDDSEIRHPSPRSPGPVSILALESAISSKRPIGSGSGSGSCAGSKRGLSERSPLAPGNTRPRKSQFLQPSLEDSPARHLSAPPSPKLPHKSLKVSHSRPRTESQPSLSSSRCPPRPKSAPNVRAAEVKEQDEPPLLVQMCDGPYMEALHAFERCSLYSNIRLDIQVRFAVVLLVFSVVCTVSLSRNSALNVCAPEVNDQDELPLVLQMCDGRYTEALHLFERCSYIQHSASFSVGCFLNVLCPSRPKSAPNVYTAEAKQK